MQNIQLNQNIRHQSQEQNLNKEDEFVKIQP